MPVSHVGLTVSHIPSACSFFLAALQPLGYKYVGKQGDQVGFGTLDADFFLSPEIPGIKSSNAHVAFSATSRSAVRDFYASALNAGGLPNGPPASRGCNDCIFNAAVLDLDGNSIEVIYHEDDDDDAFTTVTGSSRVVDWRKGIVNVLGDEDRATIVSGPPRSQASARSSGSSVAESLPRSNAPSIVRSFSEPVTSAPSQSSGSSSSFHISGKAMMGTILGAAAGAAVAYAMVKSENDSARQEAAFEEAMAYKASSKASSKAPSKVAPSVAQSTKAPPAAPKSLLSYATTNRTVPKSRAPSEARSMRSRGHRNFSTTESVIESRFTEHRNISDTETELTARPAPSRAKTEVLAIEAAPEPQNLEDVDSKSYHSPTYVSLAPTRVTKRAETEYVPASQAPSQALSKAPSMAMSRAPSKAPTERQIEYFPASVVSQRPSVASRRTVTSPPSLSAWQPEREDSSPSQSGQDGPAAEGTVISRRDSAMSVHSTRSSKSRRSRHGENRDGSPDSRVSKHSSHRSSHVSSHHSSKHRDRSPSVRSHTSRKSSRHHHPSTHRDVSPSEGSDASTVKPSSRVTGAASYHSAAGVPLPESRKTSVVSGAEMPLPESRRTSVFSAADLPLPGSRGTSVVSGADHALPASRKTSVASGAEMPLPESRRTSVVSGAQMPLPESRRTSVVSAAEHALPESRRTSVVSGAQMPLPESRKTSVFSAADQMPGSIIGSILGRSGESSSSSSAVHVPLPASEVGSIHGGLDDTVTLGPEDSISCVAARPEAQRRRESGGGGSRHSGHRSSHHSSKGGSRHGSSHHGSKSGSKTSGKSSEGNSVVTVKRVGDGGARSAASVPLSAKSKDDKAGRRSVVSMLGGVLR